MYYTLSVVLFLVAVWPVWTGWRAMVTEQAHLSCMKGDHSKEAGLFGLSGSVLLGAAGYILVTQKNVYLTPWGPHGLDTIGCGSMMLLIAVMTTFLCGITWATKPKLES